jgi:hypothetical protein
MALQQEQNTAPARKEETPQRRPKIDIGQKRKAVSLMEKARREAEAKRKKVQPPEATFT